MPYELFAIKFAESNPERRRSENFLGMSDDVHDQPLPLYFYVWVAIGHDRVILIDTGSDRATCERRGLNFVICPTEGLRRLGLGPHGIDTIISTHLHWDHAGNLDKFPNATIHAHSEEIRYATGPCMCHKLLRRTYDVDLVCNFVRLVYDDRVKFHSGDAEIAPGIVMRQGAGHTPGQCFVEVPTARGIVVIASDAMHFYDNERLGLPFPIVSDVPSYLETLGRMRERSGGEDMIVPGHDPAVMERYPALSADCERTIVRLDVAPRVAT